MDLISSNAATLQGPSSLPSHENGAVSSDFVIINGNGPSSSYDEPDIDPFASLSQADAVAQVKELLQQRNDLQSNFSECTEDLSNMTQKCNDLIEQERQNCIKAKKRVAGLLEEQAMYKAEIDRLTEELSKEKAKPSTTPAVQVTIPTSEQIEEEDNSQRLPDTPVEYCTSEPLTAQGVPTVSITTSIRESELEELRTQLHVLQGERDDLNRKLRSCLQDTQQKVHQVELKRQAAERQCADISTKFHQFRQENDLHLATLSSTNSELVAKNKDLESQLRKQADEFDSSQREILGAEDLEQSSGLRRKCNELEDSLANQVQIYRNAQREWEDREQELLAKSRNQDQIHLSAQREWEDKERVLLNNCRELDDSKMQIARDWQQRYRGLEVSLSDWQRRCGELETSQRNMQEAYAVSESEKSRSEKALAELNLEKQRADGIIAHLKPIIMDCGRNIKQLQNENDRYKRENTELNGKVEHLNRRIEDLNKSMGEEVPDLIARCDEWKEKFKAEKAAADTQKTEFQKLQEAHKKVQAELDREKRHVTKLDANVTRLKQENAQLEGNVAALHRDIGELNSNNIRMGRATTQVIAPSQLDPTPEESDERQVTEGLQPCPFACMGCTEMGDGTFLQNHIERDH